MGRCCSLVRIYKNQNLAYGRKIKFYPERKALNQIEYKDIYLDMNNKTIRNYIIEEDIYIDGHKVSIRKGFLDKENFLSIFHQTKQKQLI